jgi:hypothetical protein
VPTYEMGAFEALEWAWNLLRVQGGSGDIKETTSRIQEMLFAISSGDPVDFHEKINALRLVSLG